VLQFGPRSPPLPGARTRSSATGQFRPFIGRKNWRSSGRCSLVIGRSLDVIARTHFHRPRGTVVRPFGVSRVDRSYELATRSWSIPVAGKRGTSYVFTGSCSLKITIPGQNVAGATFAE
jgi:hypothetical protein